MKVKGFRRVSLLNTTGREIGYFTYETGDPMMVLRFGHLKSVSREVIEELMKIYDGPEGELTGAEEKQLKKLENRICDALDYFLGTESSKHVFREIKPFALMDGGRFWYSVVIDRIVKAVFPVLEETERENEQ